MRHNRTPTVLVVLLAAVLLAACATLNPGEDPVAVHTQQVLAVGQQVYDSGMTWCKANAASFSPAGLTLVNKLRTDFPPAYRALDTALDAYKSGKTGDLQAALDSFTKLVGQIEGLITGAGGPNLETPAAPKGGTP